MNDEKWYQLVESIGQQFKVISQDKTDLFHDNPVSGKEEKIGETETIVFLDKEGNEQKVERVKKKIVMDRKMHYHKTRSDAVTEYVYSESEYSDSVHFYKKSGEVWEEVR